MKTYSTRTEAIDCEIIPALGEFWRDYDIEALASEVLDVDRNGYWVCVSEEEFYELAAAHDRKGK